MKILIGAFLCHVWCGSLVYSHGIFDDHNLYHGLTKLFDLPTFDSKNKSVNIEEKWFEQPVDHFNSNDQRTWKQACINAFPKYLYKLFCCLVD